MNCAVCKFPLTGKALALRPHTEPGSVVVLHPKCMGGLPLIALKWHVLDERLQEPTTLLEVLTLGIEELKDFDEKGGDEEDERSHT